MDTKFDYKQKVKFLKENYIVIIWLLLVGSALFNFGYFWLLDIKYISFLNISDYYASSFIYLCSMLFVIACILLFTDRPKDNIIFVPLKLIVSTLVSCFNNIIYKIQLKVGEYRINHIEKILSYNKSSKYKKERDIVCKKIQRIKKIIARVKKRENLIFNRLFSILKQSVIILVVGVFLLFMFFCLFYMIYGLLCSIALFFIAIILIGTDSFFKKVNMSFVVPIVKICLLAFFSGVCMLSHDIIKNRIEVCDNQKCYDVIRKITDGYFVIDDERFFFLDNDLDIKTQQKRPAIIDIVQLIDN